MGTEQRGFPQNAWRNRPGRDLVVALAIAYALLAALALVVTKSADALAAALMVWALVPVGLLLAIMKVDLNAALGLALLVALAAVFIPRMPGRVRIPLLVVIFAGWYYCAWQAGTILN